MVRKQMRSCARKLGMVIGCKKEKGKKEEKQENITVTCEKTQDSPSSSGATPRGSTPPYSKHLLGSATYLVC
eukprot:m.24248 g.24248  ORF g.24248 m.24248 type:complete len:72 (+) comp13346_c0_seq1:127-342(+)